MWQRNRTPSHRLRQIRLVNTRILAKLTRLAQRLLVIEDRLNELQMGDILWIDDKRLYRDDTGCTVENEYDPAVWAPGNEEPLIPLASYVYARTYLGKRGQQYQVEIIPLAIGEYTDTLLKVIDIVCKPPFLSAEL
jgi:hypothetical protein